LTLDDTSQESQTSGKRTLSHVLKWSPTSGRHWLKRWKNVRLSYHVVALVIFDLLLYVYVYEDGARRLGRIMSFIQYRLVDLHFPLLCFHRLNLNSDEKLETNFCLTTIYIPFRKTSEFFAHSC